MVRPCQWSQRPGIKVTRFQRPQQGLHVTAHYSRAIRRILVPRRSMRIVQFTGLQGLLDSRKMPRRILLVDHLLCPRICPNGAIRPSDPETRPSWSSKRGFRLDMTAHGFRNPQAPPFPNSGPQKAQNNPTATTYDPPSHLLRRLHRPAACRQLPGELGCPLQDMARPRPCRRHYADHMAHSALSLRRLVPIGSIRPSNRRH